MAREECQKFANKIHICEANLNTFDTFTTPNWAKQSMRRECNRAAGMARVIAATSDPGVERLKLAGQKWAGKEVLSGNKILTRRKLSLTKYLLSLQIVQILNWRSVARPRRSRRHFENLSCFREDAWNTSKEENYKNIPETTIRQSQ